MPMSIDIDKGRTQGSSKLAIFFWIMRVCWCVVEGLVSNASACYFLLNYAYYGNYCIDYAPEECGPACYFLLNYARRQTHHSLSSLRHACYFLLNYARCNRLKGRYNSEPSNLLFSFELCLSLRLQQWLRFPVWLDLLFSFELCPFDDVCVQAYKPFFTLAIFFWIMHIYNQQFFLCDWTYKTCYFLLNYALWRLASQRLSSNTATCYFLLNYARGFCWRGGAPAPSSTACYFLLNYASYATGLAPITVSMSCYFLLNYALGSWAEDERSAWVGHLLFSFELCVYNTHLYVALFEVLLGLLFSFELCLPTLVALDLIKYFLNLLFSFELCVWKSWAGL